ncbi:unnamed protein product [Ilex paraguariensis]|uniref:Uncharacterized protein n=1 Tax=Ilex paraguariensis TaxID=185542 RepID=A0ABC8SDB0_9AQUA
MAEVAVSFLLDHLTPFLQEEARLLGGVREEVVLIKDELDRMKAFLRVADAKEKDDTQLQVLVKQLREVAYDTEDVLDEFMLRLAHHDGDGCCGFLHKIAYSIKSLIARHRIASELPKIKARFDNISKSLEPFRNIEQGSSSVVIGDTWSDGRGDALLIEEAELVGIEEPKKQLIGWLLDNDSPLKVVSVVGMGGLGKTTLVKKVFEDERIKPQFQSHAWITVSQSFNMVELLKNMIKQLYGGALPQEMKIMNNNNELTEVIQEFLRKQRYVVVLDDVWSIGAWNGIKHIFPNNNCGSRVIVTTRILDLAKTSCLESRDYIYEMKVLSDKKSWVLFCKKTFKDKTCPPHLEKISREILGKCGGLPLAIVVLSGVLALKDKSKTVEWVMVQRNLGGELEDNDKLERINKIFSLSYFYLPDYLKICFLYLSIFPEDHEIEKGQVIRLWAAERFAQEKERKLAEEVAEGYFNELLNRSLIQVLEEKIEFSPTRYRIHDLLRDFIISKSRELNIVTLASGKAILCPQKVRRLALHNSSRNVEENKCFERLRSLLVVGEVEGLDNSSVSSILRGASKLLTVLDLRGVSLETFPPEVSELVLLRYLCLRNSNVKFIPGSIGKLRNLETLDLKDAVVTELPIEIGKLRKLRYLVAGYLVVGPVEIGNFSFLQKLRSIWAGEVNGNIIMREVGKLTQLKSLKISGLRTEDGKILCSSLEKLGNLRTLWVDADARRGKWNEFELLDLKTLSSGPPLLQKLHLFGHLEETPHWIASLHSLVLVNLTGCKLRDDHLLQWLQDLPNLQRMSFQDDAYVGEELCFKAGGFKSLKYLGLFVLQELRWVRLEQGAMPHLEELEIGHCDLMGYPIGIEHLTNLRSITLHRVDKLKPQNLSDRDRDDAWDDNKLAHIPHRYIRIWHTT